VPGSLPTYVHTTNVTCEHQFVNFSVNQFSELFEMENRKRATINVPLSVNARVKVYSHRLRCGAPRRRTAPCVYGTVR